MANYKKIVYSAENREKFVKIIKKFRSKRQPLTYAEIAETMNKNGFRNRNNDKINNTFIANMLTRYVNN